MGDDDLASSPYFQISLSYVVIPNLRQPMVGKW